MRTTNARAETDVALKAIVDRVALPVWVVDHDGLVLLANPAALATLGFDDASELEGRHGHDTVHYKHLDGSPYPAEDCPVLDPSRTGEPVHRDEDWFIRRDGTLFPVSFTAVPIELPTGRGVVVTFVDMSEQRQAEQALRERDAILARVAQPVWWSTIGAASTTRTRRRWPPSATTTSPSSPGGPVTRPSTTSTPTARRSRRRTAR
jgi:PAS domain S-box-containing protein